jgi:hypothetical protein
MLDPGMHEQYVVRDTREVSTMEVGLPSGRPARFVRDAVIGFSLFVTISVGLCGMRPWTPPHAAASDVVAARAIEITSLPGPKAENAIVAAASRRPVLPVLDRARMSAMTVLALAFSLIFAFNMALLRHLKTAYVGPGCGRHRRSPNQ